MSIYSVWFYYFLWKLKVFKVERLETLIQLCVLNLWVTVLDFQIYGCGCGSFSIFGLRLRFTIAVCMCHTYSVYGIGISGISVPHMFWLAVATVSRTVANKTLWTWALFQSLHSQFEWLHSQYVFLRSILAWCIALFFWWSSSSSRSSDFEDLGKQRICAERNQKRNWFKRRLAAWRKRREVWLRRWELWQQREHFFYPSNRSKIISKKCHAC